MKRNDLNTKNRENFMKICGENKLPVKKEIAECLTNITNNIGKLDDGTQLYILEQIKKIRRLLSKIEE